MVEFQFDNDDVQAKLKEFLDNGMYQALGQGLNKAALIIESKAKQNCPVNDGQLRQSISHDVDEREGIAIIGSNTEYAPYVEVGTGIYSSEGNGRKTPWQYQNADGEWIKTSGMKPQPFLQPAADSSTDEILRTFEGLI